MAENKKKNFKGLQTISKFTKKIKETIKENIEVKKESQKLEESIKKEFNKNAMILYWFNADNKFSFNEFFNSNILLAKFKPTDKKLTFYGKEKIQKNDYFINKETNQKFIASTIDITKTMDFTIDNKKYNCPITIVTYSIEEDIKNIITNNINNDNSKIIAKKSSSISTIKGDNNTISTTQEQQTEVKVDKKIKPTLL